MNTSKLTSLKIEMEKISVKIKDALRERYPTMKITDEEAREDQELVAGDEYSGERELELICKVNPRANMIEELTVCETFELVEWIEKHIWILKGDDDANN